MIYKGKLQVLATLLAIGLLITTSRAETPAWAKRMAAAYEDSGELLRFESGDLLRYRAEVNYPYWQTFSYVGAIMEALTPHRVKHIRFNYTVIVSNWEEWKEDPTTEKPDWLHGIRSRTKAIIIRRPRTQTTRIFTEEQVQVRKSPDGDWETYTRGLSQNYGLRAYALVPLSLTRIRYCNNWDAGKSLISNFKKNPDFGSSPDFQLPDGALPNELSYHEWMKDVDGVVKIPRIDLETELENLQKLKDAKLINSSEYRLLVDLAERTDKKAKEQAER